MSYRNPNGSLAASQNESQSTDFHIRPVSFGDTNLLRFWRNSSHVRPLMANRAFISHKAQRNWFLNRDSETEKRFIYGLGSVDVGSVHAELRGETFQVGIMCGDRAFLGHWVNLAAAMYIYDLGFLGYEKAFAHASIRPENSSSIRLCEALGFVETRAVEEGLSRYELERENYLLRRGRFSKFLFWPSGTTEDD